MKNPSQTIDQNTSCCERFLPQWYTHLGEGIIIADTDGEICAANQPAAKIFGVPAQEMPGQHLAEFIPVAVHPLLCEDGVASHQVTGYHITGRMIPLAVTLTVYPADSTEGAHRVILVEDLRPPQGTENPLEKLSSRELQVARLVTEGYTSREIAAQLSISIKTVERHRANIMQKLRTPNVVLLVRLVLRYDTYS